MQKYALANQDDAAQVNIFCNQPQRFTIYDQLPTNGVGAPLAFDTANLLSIRGEVWLRSFSK